MTPGEEMPKLKMAQRETIEEMSHRIERLQRAQQLQRESELENSLAPFRVGSVPYLNAIPLTRGLEEQITFVTPAKLAELLRKGELDAALVSIAEVLLNDAYEILDGIAIASLGEVKSVLVAHRKPLEEITEIHCDTASITSVNLMKVLLAERGLKPKLVPLANYESAAAMEAVLLIGDRALDFCRTEPPHVIWDLGEAWYELTNLPFVYAVWALRRGAHDERLRRLLREARDFGMDTLDYLIASRTDYDLDFRRDYLTWNIHYHLGADERRGITRFIELLRKHNLGPVYEPRFIA
jgi:chorismate dehydratase